MCVLHLYSAHTGSGNRTQKWHLNIPFCSETCLVCLQRGFPGVWLALAHRLWLPALQSQLHSPESVQEPAMAAFVAHFRGFYLLFIERETLK